MMSSPESAGAIYGVSLLLRFDKRGFAFFNATPAGVWRSLRVAFLILPVFFIEMVLRVNLADEAPPLWRFFTIETLCYAISWLAFPVIMWHLAAVLDRQSRFCAYIVPYNWFHIATAYAYLPILILAGLGLMPQSLSLLFTLIFLAAYVLYNTFIAIEGLDLTPGTAMLIVVFDIVLSLMISQIALALVAQS